MPNLRITLSRLVALEAEYQDLVIRSALGLFAGYGLQVWLVEQRDLDLPHLSDLLIGWCEDAPTDEQLELYSNRGAAAATDACIYVVRSTWQVYNGCAVHPKGLPGSVFVFDAPVWTLAHEIGHVLGFQHVADNRFLMTEFGTTNITEPVPLLSEADVAAMNSSSLVFP